MSPPRRFALMDEHGTPLGDYETMAEALGAFDHLIAADPSAAAECYVAEFDGEGSRVGTFAPRDPNQGWFVMDAPRAESSESRWRDLHSEVRRVARGRRR